MGNRSLHGDRIILFGLSDKDIRKIRECVHRDIECDKEYEKYILKFDGEQMSLFEEEDEDIEFW